LRAELRKLKQETRPHIIAAIAEARAHGDLKENAEYHAAREQQSFTEGRINDIEAKLSFAEIIDVIRIPNHGKVIFGSSVTLYDLDTEEEVTYQIVGEDEADLQQGKISYTSPIARALIGKAESDEVTVPTPKAKKQFEILRVEYR
jgi:transcription elongation factor GreA